MNANKERDVADSSEGALRRGISVRWMLGLMTVTAIAAAALVNPRSVWAPALTNLNVAAQLAAVLFCIYARGPARAFAAGFAICNGFFLGLEFVPDWGRPLIRRMLPWAIWSSGSPMLVGEPNELRAYVGMIVSGFLYGYGGGALARHLHLRYRRAS